ELVEFMHLGAGAFHNLSGEKANVVAFVQAIRDPAKNATPTHFIDLRGPKSASEKYRGLREGSALDYRESTAAFDALPGRVLAYWLPQTLRQHFQNTRRLADIATIPGAQNKTGRNHAFIRKWSEVASTQ